MSIMSMIDEIYTAQPFYGKRRIAVALQARGYDIGIKKVRKLMNVMGIEAVYPKPNLSLKNSYHKIYPYLLKNVAITKENQVWSTDITYIRLSQGFLYLVAIIDWYSRYVLAWKLSLTLEKEFCLDVLDEALTINIPEIFNSDQGVQFTSHEFTQKLKQNNIRISMDGRGRCLDNIIAERLWRTVKYEEVYLKNYDSPLDAHQGLSHYFYFYNHHRPHQSLSYNTPASLYFNSIS